MNQQWSRKHHKPQTQPQGTQRQPQRRNDRSTHTDREYWPLLIVSPPAPEAPAAAPAAQSLSLYHSSKDHPGSHTQNKMESFYTALKDVSNSISQTIANTISHSSSYTPSTTSTPPSPPPPSNIPSSRQIARPNNTNNGASPSSEKLNSLAVEIAVSIIQLGVISIGIWYWKKWLANVMGGGAMNGMGRGVGGDQSQARERLTKMLSKFKSFKC